jgi:hypothetical protein
MPEAIDPRSFYTESDPGLVQSLVMDLSCEFQAEEDGHRRGVISWENQCKAAAYFNAHGFESTVFLVSEMLAKWPVVVVEQQS